MAVPSWSGAKLCATRRKEVAMKRIGKTVAKAVVSVLAGTAMVAGGLYVAGLASATNQEPAALVAAPAAQETPSADQPHRPGLLKGAVHADVTARYLDGTTRTFSMDPGKITGLDGGSITIERRDGETVAAPTNEDTCIRKEGQPATLQELELGARAVVAQEGGTAVAVRSGRPQPGAERQPCGLRQGVVHADITVTYLDGSTRTFAYDRGQITSITSSEITLVRRDQKNVTLSYDDSTFVREEGQPGSVSDLSVGDRAMFFSEGRLAKLIRCISKAPAA
jgi:hypothetical protein